MPGFSTYLHPLGDGLLLGLGQDADQHRSGLRHAGLRVRRLRPVPPGAPGPVAARGRLVVAALDDSRAFGYDPERRLATFPFTSYDPSGGGQERPGAVGVSVAEDGTLRLAGRLDTAAGSWPQRVLSDGDRVYAVTDNAVVAGDASTMARTGELTFGGWADGCGTVTACQAIPRRARIRSTPPS